MPRARRLVLGALTGALFAARLLQAGPSGPPPSEATIGASFAGAETMDGSAVQTPRTNASHASVEALFRRPTGLQGAFAVLGVEADDYGLGGTAPWPGAFRDAAIEAGAEYYRDGELAASVVVSPGLYGDRRLSGGCFDFPVLAATGIPLGRAWNGLVGVENGRFSQHPLPIVGVVGTPRRDVQLELAFPNPAIVIHEGSGDWRLGGELTGGGFIAALAGTRTPVDLSLYRVGLRWSARAGPAALWTVGTGVELERELNAYEVHRRIHGSGAMYLEASVAFTPYH